MSPCANCDPYSYPGCKACADLAEVTIDEVRQVLGAQEWETVLEAVALNRSVVGNPTPTEPPKWAAVWVNGPGQPHWAIPDIFGPVADTETPTND